MLAQQSPAPAPEDKPATAAPAVPATRELAAAETGPATSEDIVVLSPFEVVEDTRGYFAANSMSGTRFNSKLEDLGSSITVITKSLMSDFAMLDVNDVFMYTASTEGTATYTDYVMDRGGQLTDNVQMNPAGANRVRGISSANPTLDNFELSGRVPIDPLIIDAIEVSRGPNSTISGLGNPGGTVNQVSASANLQRTRGQMVARVDALGGYRGSIDWNQVLIPGKLAIRVSDSQQKDEFVRKPSGVTTERLNVMLKAQPFKGTTITGSVFSYKMHGNRPNFTPPRDYVSYWLESGSPGWDPTTGFITSGGTRYGMTSLTNGTPLAGSSISYSTSAATLGLVPSYFSAVGGAFTRANLYIDQSGITYWQAPTNNTGVTPTTGGGLIRLMGTSSSDLKSSTVGRYDAQPLWTTTKSVSSKELYDWSEINLSAVNRLRDETETYIFRVDQIILDTPQHFLAGQVAVLREDSERYQRTPLGNSSNSGQTGQLWVDVNLKNLDGSVNPNFGRLFMGTGEPITRLLPQRWDAARAQLAYRLDLSKEQDWKKWIGSHTFSPYFEFKERVSRSYGYRDVLTSDHSWTAVGQNGFTANTGRAIQANVVGGPQAGPNILRQFYRYYVGDAGTGKVQYAPSTFAYGNYSFNWGTTGNWRHEDATLGELATTDTTGGNNNQKQRIYTPGAVLQSFLLDGRFVTTFGVRRDRVFTKNGLTPVLLTDGNTAFDYERIDSWQDSWKFASGDTKSVSAVARPFRDLGVFKSMASSSSGMSRFVSELFRGMAFSYNKSDNFLVQSTAVDLYLNDLPNTTAKGTDYGIWLNLFDGKLVVRATSWDNKQYNIRNGDANTVAQRVMRMDFDVSGDSYQLYDRANGWARALNPTWSDAQVTAYIADVMKIPTALYDSMLEKFRAGQIAATNDVYGKGVELEINYNPTRNWSIAASVTKTESKNMNVSSTVQQWIDERMPVWTSIVDPNTNPNVTYGTDAANRGWTVASQTLPVANPNHLWWIHRYGTSGQSASENFQTFVVAPYAVLREQEGKSLPSVRKYNVRLNTSYQLAGITDHPILKKFKVGGAIRWEDRGAIGFYGEDYAQWKDLAVAARPKILKLDPNNPVWDSSHAYFDLMLSYKTKLWKEKVDATFQINARNLGEHGELRAIGVFPDGEPNAYRIFDPQQFIFQVTFDL
ncbi:MAG TPA: TonB-dependent receptor [Opitutaceae bacterium]|nr:TonB-dependent receptor [Opitutaceae bacterium]